MLVTAYRNPKGALFFIDNDGSITTTISGSTAENTQFFIKDNNDNNVFIGSESSTTNTSNIKFVKTSHDFQTTIVDKYVTNGSQSDCAYRLNWNDDMDVIKTADNMFLFTAVFCDDSSVVKINSSGDLEWTISESALSFNPIRVIEDFNQDYVIIGHEYDGEQYHNIVAQKVDSNGNEIWRKTYETNFLDFASDIIPITDGGYLIGADTYIDGVGDRGLIIKIDASGNRIF